MCGRLVELGAVRALVWEGPPIAGDRDAADLVGAALGEGAGLVVLPVARLAAGFLELRTGLAGAVLQKLVNYGLRAAVVGDISQAVSASDALCDFVRESNRGRHVWFAPDMAALEARLAGS